MTAWTRTTHEIYCNARIPYPTADNPDLRISCLKTYEPPEDKAHLRLAPAVLRTLAAKDGWTHIRSPCGRRFDTDLCPEHKPEEIPGTSDTTEGN